MAKNEPFLAYVMPVGGGDRPDRPARPDEPVDPSYGIPLPPTVWPPPEKPARPGWNPVDPGYGHPDVGGRPGHDLPSAPVRPTHPIVIPPPEGVPPGEVYPPLPPDSVPPEGGLILVWVPGVGYKWIRVTPPPSKPVDPAEPK